MFYFKNALGVYESVKLNNPAVISSFDRQEMTLDGYQTNRYGGYSNNNDIQNPKVASIFNEIKKTLGTTEIQQVKFFSEILSESDQTWFKDFYTSDSIYMEIAPMKFVPVIPLDDAYDMTPRQYTPNKSVRVKEVNFKLPENFDINFLDFNKDYNQSTNAIIGFQAKFN